MRTRATALVALAMLSCVTTLAEEPKSILGKKVSDFTLKDYRGHSVSLDTAAKGKPVVLAFLGTECPLCKMYAPRLDELAKEYEAKGVVFLGIDPNRQDSVTEIAAYARVHGIELPDLQGLEPGDGRPGRRHAHARSRRARQGARGSLSRPDRRSIRLQVKRQLPEGVAKREDLAEALDEVLAGKPVATAETKTAGCLIGRDRKPVAGSDVTYTKQIARILNANCVSCHREGQIAPFTLTNYEEVAGWAGMIEEVVQSQRMPPWHADPQVRPFPERRPDERRGQGHDQPSGSPAGAPQGDPKDLPEPPKFAEGWMIPKPDQVIYMADEAVRRAGHRRRRVPDVRGRSGLDRRQVDLAPSSRGRAIPAVVHHILLFVIPPDGKINAGLGSGNDFFGAFAPGLRPEPLPTGMARFVPAGSKLIFQMHYTPNGSAAEGPQLLRVRVRRSQDREAGSPRQRAPSTSCSRFRQATAISTSHSRYIFRQDTTLLTLMPHMHLRGKAFRYEATYPDGKKEVLLDVPRYDFGWQTNYRLAEPKFMPVGTRMDCFAHFDNSDDNLNNPDPKATVRFGDQTFEEMMIGFFEATPAHEDRLHPESAGQAAVADGRVQRHPGRHQGGAWTTMSRSVRTWP